MALRKFIWGVVLTLALWGTIEPANAQYNKDYFYWAGRRCLMDKQYLEAIRILEERGMLENLPDKLKEAVDLRMAHPELTLSQLAELCDPPVSKSAFNHRLRKLMELAKQ